MEGEKSERKRERERESVRERSREREIEKVCERSSTSSSDLRGDPGAGLALAGVLTFCVALTVKRHLEACPVHLRKNIMVCSLRKEKKNRSSTHAIIPSVTLASCRF